MINISNTLDPNTIFSPSSILSEKVWLVFFSVKFRFARYYFRKHRHFDFFMITLYELVSLIMTDDQVLAHRDKIGLGPWEYLCYTGPF